jgi:hypothetical protein
LADAAPALASKFLARLLRDLRPHVDACGARIGVDQSASAATLLYLTLSLSKKPSAPVYPFARGASAFPETVVAPL